MNQILEIILAIGGFFLLFFTDYPPDYGVAILFFTLFFSALRFLIELSIKAANKDE